MTFKLDPEVNALYITLKDGDVAQTVEFEDDIYLDTDQDGQVMGIEFVDATDFIAFMARHGGEVRIPEHFEVAA